jgi:hypothetical protein
MSAAAEILQLTTARRLRKGSKVTVEVTLPDGRSVELGGKRAERANFALITTLLEGHGVAVDGTASDYWEQDIAPRIGVPYVEGLRVKDESRLTDRIQYGSRIHVLQVSVPVQDG